MGDNETDLDQYRAVISAGPDDALEVLGPGPFAQVRDNARELSRNLGIIVLVERVEEI